MNSEIPNLDAEFAETPSNTLRNVSFVLVIVAAGMAGVLGVSVLRGAWPSPDVLIGGAVGTAYCAWVVAKRRNDGWRVSTVVACFGTFFAILAIALGMVGIGTTPMAWPILITGGIVLTLSIGFFMPALMTTSRVRSASPSPPR